MSVSREELAAFADGELGPERSGEIAALVEGDPALASEVAAHRALKARLAARFAPIAEEPVPEHLAAILRPQGKVADLAEARARREARRGLPRWTWVAGPALAASLALALLIPRGGEGDYATGGLAAALDERLVSEQMPAEAERILLSFRDRSGVYCRAFAGADRSGIACRDEEGWRLRTLGPGDEAQAGDYRMAGSGTAAIMEQAQVMAVGGALSAEEERAARARGWR